MVILYWPLSTYYGYFIQTAMYLLWLFYTDRYVFTMVILCYNVLNLVFGISFQQAAHETLRVFTRMQACVCMCGLVQSKRDNTARRGIQLGETQYLPFYYSAAGEQHQHQHQAYLLILQLGTLCLVVSITHTYNCGRKWLCDCCGNSSLSQPRAVDSITRGGLIMQPVGVAGRRMAEQNLKSQGHNCLTALNVKYSIGGLGY